MIVVTIVLLGICGYWIYCMILAYRMNRMTSSLPAPPGFPLIGNAMHFLGDSQHMFKNIKEIAELAFKNKQSAKVWLGSKLYVCITDPEDSQVVLENCLDKDAVYRFLQPWLGHGLFVAPVDIWKSHRKVLLPVFHNKIVEEYVGVIAEQADILLERLSEQSGQGPFDALEYITACTLDIVFETAMGERMDVQHSPDTPYLRARHTVMTILNMRLFKVWLQPDFLFNLTHYAKQQKDNIELTHKFTDEVVKKRRLEHCERMEGKSSKANKGGSNLSAVLDLLFGHEINFTDEQLREHIDSITIAGNDTTALVIAYTLVMLGVYKDVQEKVLNEQKLIFGASTRGATKEEITKMFYLERVVKETMRLYTVVPLIARNVDKDVYLPTCGATLPAGSGAVILAFAMHTSPAVWGPTASEFDPDRFLPERSATRHPAAFVPFSYGARNCIGRNFGMIIMKSILSSVVRSYKIEADELGPLKIEMLLFPIKGHQIRVTKRY